MIADVYKCPKCGINVYLGHDETDCPVCCENNRDTMELVQANVDLEHNASLDTDARYANFKHLVEILRIPYGDEAGLYANDTWERAWDPSKIDSENIENAVAFIKNPNDYLFHKEPMGKEAFKKEVERIVNKIIRKCECEDDGDELDAITSSSYVNKNCYFRLYVKNDLSSVSAETITERTQESVVYNYLPLERNNPVPVDEKGYFVISGKLYNHYYPRELFDGAAKKIAGLVTDYCFSAPWWKQSLNFLKYYFLWRSRPFSILY